MEPAGPQRILATLIGYQFSATLACALRLELFTLVASGADTLAQLALRLEASERGLRALCNALVAHGFLRLEGGRYRLAPDSAAYLDRRSPAYLGSVAEFLNDPGLARHFDGLEEAVRRGGTRDPEGGTIGGEDPLWVRFAEAMAPMARLYAEPMADELLRAGTARRVLDVAAGHGCYGLALARRVPGCAITFQDWPSVLEVARANARELGTRARFLAGSAFELEFPAGQDLVLLTNFVHHFERERAVALLTKARRALAPGGRVAMLEILLEDDRVTPAPSAAFDLVMLATTPRGEAYTRGEYAELFRAAGLATPAVQALVDPGHGLFVAASAG